MQVGLTLRKLGFASACLLVLVPFSICAWRSVRAGLASRSQELPDLQRAAALEPGNAEPQQRLGRYHTLVLNDVAQGRAHAEAAVALNPYKARFWLDLALIHQLSGDVAQEKRAIERALKAEPTTPNVAWEAANLYVVLGEWEPALPLLRTVLQRDPSLRRPALELALRANRSVAELLQGAVPPSVPIYVDFLHVLVRRKDAVAAGVVWARLIALGEPVSASAALPYINLLVSERQADQARQAWQDLARVTPSLAGYVEPDNLVTNSGFEEKMLGTGLDWRVSSQPGVEVALDEVQARSGKRSMRIRFGGAYIPQAGIAQLVAVQPASAYRLMAWVKTENLESVNGPRLQLTDAATGVQLLLGDEMGGSEPWHAVRAEFSTGPQTRVVMVRVVRSPLLGQIRGTLWLDDVRMAPGEPSEKQP